MFKRRAFTMALAAIISLSVLSTPVFANPGNGNGNGGGNGGGNGHGNSSGNHGNSNNKSNQGNSQSTETTGVGKNYGKPDHVESDISVSQARELAVNYGLTGYQSLPPGIAKNLARGKPLPPGIARKTVPASMLGQLPNYPGYEWKIIGNDLVLVALSTAIVTAIINNVFQ